MNANTSTKALIRLRNGRVYHAEHVTHTGMWLEAIARPRGHSHKPVRRYLWPAREVLWVRWDVTS